MADRELNIEITTTAGLAELDRYDEKMKELAVRQREFESAANAAKMKEEAIARKLFATQVEKQKAAEKVAENQKAAAEVAIATGELGKLTATYTKEQVAAIAVDAKAFTSKQQLGLMFKMIGRELPIIGTLGRLVFNPIVGSVAAIAGAFSIWNWRMKEAMSTLVGFQSTFEGGKNFSAKHINDAAIAAKSYSDALQLVKDKYDSISGAVTLNIAALKEIAELRNQELSDQEAVEMARAKTDAQREEIKKRYGKTGKETDEGFTQAQIDLKTKEMEDLKTSAANKKAIAEKIKVSSKEDESEIGGEHAKNAAAAAEEYKKRENRLAELEETQATGWTPAKSAKFFTRYGMGTSVEQAMTIERDQMEVAKGAMDAEKNFKKGAYQRQLERDAKAKLEAESKDEAGRAEDLSRTLPIEQENFNKRRTAGVKHDRMANLAALEAKGVAKAKEIKDKSDAIAEAGTSVKPSDARELAKLKAELAALKNKIAIEEHFTRMGKPGADQKKPGFGELALYMRKDAMEDAKAQEIQKQIDAQASKGAGYNLYLAAKLLEMQQNNAKTEAKIAALQASSAMK